MVSPTNGTTESLIDRIRTSAIRLVNRPTYDLDLVTQIHRHRAAAAKPVGALPPDPTPTGDGPPDEFRATLRRAKGEQHHVLVEVDGQSVPLVLNARGETNTAREDYLWRWFVRRVRRGIHPGAPA